MFSARCVWRAPLAAILALAACVDGAREVKQGLIPVEVAPGGDVGPVPIDVLSRLFGTPAWREHLTCQAPQRTSGPVMAYDRSRGVSVLYTGVPSQGVWEWNGSSWKAKAFSGGPSLRHGFTLAYHVALGKTVLFGGYTVAGNAWVAQNEAWAWDGAAWSQLAPSGAAPSPRYGHAATYDTARGQLLVYGGVGQRAVPCDATVPCFVEETLDDLWALDTIGWTLLGDGQAPGRRRLHAMAFDETRHSVMLIGGQVQSERSGPFARDRRAWFWDGSAWTNADGACPSEVCNLTEMDWPGPRISPALVYDAAHDAFALFGGEGEAHAHCDCDPKCFSACENFPLIERRDDLWLWRPGSGFQEIPRSQSSWPSARSAPPMAYDVARAEIVLFSGDDGSTSPGPAPIGEPEPKPAPAADPLRHTWTLRLTHPPPPPPPAVQICSTRAPGSRLPR